MRTLALALLIGGAAIVAVGAQGDAAALEQRQLRILFPTAESFSPKEGDPAHFKAYGPGGRIIGYAFYTTDLLPLERGYDGPIRILAGMTPAGILTDIIIVQHNEPYGDFSIDPPAFREQFAGKDIRDPFRVGGDIDAVSRATITVTSATRAVRNSARRIARELLAPAAR